MLGKALLLFGLALAYGKGGKGGGSSTGNGGGSGGGKKTTVGTFKKPPKIPTGTPGAVVAGVYIPAAARPPGNPLNRSCADYSRDFWPTQVSIKNRFAELGYAVPTDRNTMNKLGPDGKIGGGDDVYSHVVAMFQDHYNLMSGRQMLGASAGGLKVDGFVGGCTLNAIENVTLFVPADQWMDALQVA